MRFDLIARISASQHFSLSAPCSGLCLWLVSELVIRYGPIPLQLAAGK
jgi:hypothetical protein